MPKIKYEYIVSDNVVVFLDALNKYGEAGWRVIHIEHEKRDTGFLDTYTAFLERVVD